MAPGTEVFAQQYADQPFEILALDLWDGTPAQCESFRTETGITYPILMMAGAGGISEDYNCSQTSFFVIDGQGIIRYRRTFDEGGMPAFRPEEIGPIVDQAIAELAVAAAGGIPQTASFELKAAYPNPFNPSTTIPYKLATGAGFVDVSLQILDMRGRLVKTLVSTSQETGKQYQVSWHGRNQREAAMPSGVYLVNLRVGAETRGRLINLVQ